MKYDINVCKDLIAGGNSEVNKVSVVWYSCNTSYTCTVGSSNGEK